MWWATSPIITGSFNGDEFDSDTTSGTFSWSDTGYDRTGSTSVQDICRLVYTLDNPITLDAGTYWFSHDARIVLEPMSVVVWSVIAVSVGGATWYKRRKAVA